MAADSSKYFFFSQMEEYSNQENDNFICAFNIIYLFYIKDLFLIQIFSFSVFERFKKKKIKLE